MPFRLPVRRPLRWPRLPEMWLPRGQSMVEFALVLPIFALFLVIAVDFGRVFFTYIEINNAAREGAAVAALDPTFSAEIRSKALQETNVQTQGGEAAKADVSVTQLCADSTGAALDCSLASGGAGPGNAVTVTVSEPFTFITPLVNNVLGNAFHISTSATATVLGYAAGTGGPPPPGCSLPIPTFSVIVDNTLTVFADPTGSTPNSGTCNISGYNWSWGDGNDEVGSATGNPHTYSFAGTYTITLEVTNQAGASTTTRIVTVPAAPPPPTCAKPTANFTFTTGGQGNKTFTYRDTSTVPDPAHCPITDWLWTFTDDGGLQSNAQNPAPVTYGNSSAHPVTLRVTNAGGAVTITKSTP